MYEALGYTGCVWGLLSRAQLGLDSAHAVSPSGEPSEETGQRGGGCSRHQQQRDRLLCQAAQVPLPVREMQLCHRLGARVSEPHTSASGGQLHGPVSPLWLVLHLRQLPQPPPLHRPQGERPGGGGGGGSGASRAGGGLRGGGAHGDQGKRTGRMYRRAFVRRPRGQEITGPGP